MKKLFLLFWAIILFHSLNNFNAQKKEELSNLDHDLVQKEFIFHPKFARDLFLFGVPWFYRYIQSLNEDEKDAFHECLNQLKTAGVCDRKSFNEKELAKFKIIIEEVERLLKGNPQLNWDFFITTIEGLTLLENALKKQKSYTIKFILSGYKEKEEKESEQWRKLTKKELVEEKLIPIGALLPIEQKLAKEADYLIRFKEKVLFVGAPWFYTYIEPLNLNEMKALFECMEKMYGATLSRCDYSVAKLKEIIEATQKLIDTYHLNWHFFLIMLKRWSFFNYTIKQGKSYLIRFIPDVKN